MELIHYIFIGLLGLCIGSFLNVVIYRIPRDKKVRSGRSFCPGCEKQLKWYHNVPLLSFLVLRGKCGFCGARISFRYPLVEALNALCWLYFAWEFGLTLQLGVFAFLSSALIAIFFIDLDFQIIPDLITLPGMVVGLGISFLPDGIGIVSSLIGLLVGGGALYLVALLGDWLFKKESMGGGDIKMAAMLGAFLGWQKVLFIFLASAGIGLVVSVILMIFSAKLRQQRMVPFGPFIATAAMLAIIWGDQIIAYYVTNFLHLQ
ncbi:MAG: prepilin peptidase [bacterium]|nr:prepilin peptidase [bacterium]